MAGIATALATIGAIAASIGMSEGLSAIEEKIAGRQPGLLDLQAKVNAVLDYASRKGNRVLEKIASRLENVVAPFGMSNTIQHYLSKARRELRDKQKTVTQVQDQISEESTKASGYVTAHEGLSNMGKIGAAGKTLRGLASDHANKAKSLADSLNRVEKTL